MEKFSYLIVGGGMTADAAVKGIREVDPEGTIGLISAEEHPPYKRPPLSKKLWTGKAEETIWLKSATDHATLFLGRRVVRIDLREKQVVDTRGTTYAFDKLLLATGTSPKRLPLGSDSVIHFRTLDDYRRLREMTERHSEFLAIGGGFIGSEIASALAVNGKNVTMIFPEAGIGARAFPADLSSFLVDYYRTKGVSVLAGDSAVTLDEHGDRLKVKTQGGQEIEVNGVVAGVGVGPEIELALEAGLSLDNGIAVDEFLNVGHPDVFAAGDAASFPNQALGHRIRVEHEDCAVTTGTLAGRNMAGAQQAYTHLPYFYSDLFDLGYEAVGEVDSSLNETFADWKDPFQEGVVYYLRDGRVRGVLLWNVWDKVPEAQALIAEPGPFSASDLAGRISA